MLSVAAKATVIHRVAPGDEGAGVLIQPPLSALNERASVANPWFRFYCEFDGDPKVQMMSEADQRRLVMLFCARCRDEELTDTQWSFRWRVSLTEVARTKAVFIESGFIDDNWVLRNWDKRQAPSDFSKDRTKRWRQKSKTDVTADVTVGDRHGDGIEERRGEEIRREESRGDKIRPAAKSSGSLISLDSIFSTITPRRTPTLPRNKAEMMAAGFVFSNTRACQGCGEDLEWWTSPKGASVPVLAASGDVHLGACAAEAKRAN